MNKMFDLPVKQSIELDKDLVDKVLKFHRTLSDEVNELLDIANEVDTPVTIDHYVALADLLGDVVVYCASEAAKHGIYLPEVLQAIMESQWSKLGANGEVIKDKNGKFLKGENYKPPEETIKNLLQARNRMVVCSINSSIVDNDNDYKIGMTADE